MTLTRALQFDLASELCQPETSVEAEEAQSSIRLNQASRSRRSREGNWNT